MLDMEDLEQANRGAGFAPLEDIQPNKTDVTNEGGEGEVLDVLERIAERAPLLLRRLRLEVGLGQLGHVQLGEVGAELGVDLVVVGAQAGDLLRVHRAENLKMTTVYFIKCSLSRSN